MSQINFAIATASGRAAIATIIVYGEDAISIAKKVFRPVNRKTDLANSLGQVVYGNWLTDGKRGEDLIVCPISQNHFEIHCHGSVAAIEIICQTLVQHQVSQISAGEMANLLSGSNYFGDLLQASTLASTARTAKVLLKQNKLHKKFWRAVERHVDQGQPGQAVAILEEFLSFTGFGLSLTHPFKVVFCGAPNVGKSSLVNAILGFERAIVHDVAGTTRDAVSETTVIDGWPVVLTDTAGIRKASDQLEEQGIGIARDSMTAADLLILVVDLVEANEELVANQIEKHHPQIVVGNKSDLALPDIEQVDLSVSATQPNNLESLMDLILARLVPTNPEKTQPIPVTQLQVKLASQVMDSIENSELESTRQILATILGG